MFQKCRLHIYTGPFFSSVHNLAVLGDPGCLSRIPDPVFIHPGSRISDPGSNNKNKRGGGKPLRQNVSCFKRLGEYLYIIRLHVHNTWWKLQLFSINSLKQSMHIVWKDRIRKWSFRIPDYNWYQYRRYILFWSFAFSRTCTYFDVVRKSKVIVIGFWTKLVNIIAINMVHSCLRLVSGLQTLT